MTLAAPLGLLGLLGLPTLIGLYFLRRRQPPRTVSALFLWRSPDRRAEAGPRLERFSREISFALECGAVLAATTFLVGPRCGESGARSQAVLVVDSSLSMGARRHDGRTVADAALARARELAQAAGHATLVWSGTHPRVLLGPAAPAHDLDHLTFVPLGPSHDLGPSLALARELAGPGARVVLLTDKPLAGPLAPEVEVDALGEPLENTAFIGARRRDQDGHAHLVLQVARFGGPARVPVTLHTPSGQLLHGEVLELADGAQQQLRVDLAASGPIVAELPGDALDADNRLTLLPNPRRIVRVSLELPNDPSRHAIERALLADGQVVLGQPADLTFAAEDGLPASPGTVKVGTRGKVDALAGPFFADKLSPLLAGVELDRVVWVAGAAPVGNPLLTLGEKVLASEEPGSAFHLNIDLGRSGLVRTPAWPILVANLLDLRRQALDGVRPRQVPVGGAMTLSLAAGHRWALDGPAGRRDLLAVGQVSVPAPEVPGTYDLLQDGTPLEQLEVEAVAPAESDLRDRSSGLQPSSASIGTAVPDAPRRPTWPLALLAGLLAADWWLTGPKRGTRWVPA